MGKEGERGGERGPETDRIEHRDYRMESGIMKVGKLDSSGL